jgi:hypothetical protein
MKMDIILGTMMNEHPQDIIGRLPSKPPTLTTAKNYAAKMNLLPIH